MISHFLELFVSFVWNWPVTLLCLISGIYFTLRMVFVQIKCLPHAVQLILGKYDNPNETGQITHFQALSAALSGTIGLGNISGVAIAISMGGPGSILWMWIVGFLGMATKFVECTLGTYYRHQDPKTGNVYGGPMYYIKKGLGSKWSFLSFIYCFCIIFAGFGSACMFQSNQAASALFNFYGVPSWITGFCLMIITGLVILGGIKRIGKVASKIVPSMCLIYVFGALLICFLNAHLLPDALSVIFKDAFSGDAVAGAGIGTVIIWGVRRAIFSNEAGLGSAAIAHAAVKTNYPVREGYVAAFGPLIDTLIVCTSTALVIVLAGFYGSGRYIPQESSLSFESAKQYFSSPVNTIVNEPENKNRFIDGQHYLSLNTTNASDLLLFGPFQAKSDAFRFAYKALSGTLSIHVLDENKKLLGPIFSDNQFLNLTSPTDDQNIFMESQSNYKTNEWAHALFVFSDSYKSKNPTFYLQVRASSETQWYFDAFSNVKALNGIALTSLAFDKYLTGFGSVFIALSVFFFAFSTMITWSYYGETALFYLFKGKGIITYKLIFVLLAFYGATISLTDVINFSDLMIGLLVIPNVIAIFMLLPTVKKLSMDYFHNLKAGKIRPFS